MVIRRIGENSVKIVLLVEGWTEKELPLFLKRWLDPQLAQPVGIQAVRFNGATDFMDNVATKTRLHLTDRNTIAVFGLLDLYGLRLPYPKHAEREERTTFAKNQILQRINADDRTRFRQHFAVHEIEAWFLSDPRLFLPNITLPAKCNRPEEVDFDEPPAKLLDRLYSQGGGRGYKKITMARNLFPKLDPNLVYQKCPNFKLMMDEMLGIARQAIRA